MSIISPPNTSFFTLSIIITGAQNIIVIFADFMTYKFSQDVDDCNIWKNITSLRPDFGPFMEWFPYLSLLKKR